MSAIISRWQIWTFMVLGLFGCQAERTPALNAQLLRSRLVNYQNPSFSREPPWLEYIFAVTNNSDSLVNFCFDTGLFILRSNQYSTIDTLYLSIGVESLQPGETDTIRVIDFFIGKGENIREADWLSPRRIDCVLIEEAELFLHQTKAAKTSVNGCVDFLRIEKAASFSFSIE